jgi:uncharacterized protein with ParB-like and HNH nuclease domain
MAHIANKIHAEDIALNKIFSHNRYRIEAFQREYRWEKKHVEALISDLSTNFFGCYNQGDTMEKVDGYNCYYMGPVVLCDEGGAKSIVDGQQRLTSFTLLFIYLNHLQQKLAEENRADLMQYLYVRKAGKSTLVLNVPTREAIVEKLIELGLNEIDTISDEVSKSKDESVINIYDRYSDICTLFPEELKHDDVLPLFMEWLQEKVTFVQIDAYSIENAYSIFETMNDRGLNLGPAEILKAYLLSKIEDEEKGEEMNQFWKDRIAAIRYVGGAQADELFIRGWLRAKYALTTRAKTAGAENEDFEIIGNQFNSWIKANAKRLGLREPVDFYNFVKSDFAFYSSVYMDLYQYQHQDKAETLPFYVTAQYPLADSLQLPLFLSSIRKTDTKDEIMSKLYLVNTYIDVYVNRRILWNKSVTQSTVRDFIYNQVREIRGMKVDELRAYFTISLHNQFDEMLKGNYPLHCNLIYAHYFLSRIVHFCCPEIPYETLVRSRRKNSHVLKRIFTMDEQQELVTSNIGFEYSIPNLCLVHRSDSNDEGMDQLRKLEAWTNLGYLPELRGQMFNHPKDFLMCRQQVLVECIDKIWPLDIQEQELMDLSMIDLILTIN